MANSRTQIDNNFLRAVEAGNLDEVRSFFTPDPTDEECFHHELSSGVIEEGAQRAAAHGRVEVTCYLLQLMPEEVLLSWIVAVVSAAAEHGQVDVLHHLIEDHNNDILDADDEDVMREAICAAMANGHLNVLPLLLQHVTIETISYIVSEKQPSDGTIDLFNIELHRRATTSQ